MTQKQGRLPLTYRLVATFLLSLALFGISTGIFQNTSYAASSPKTNKSSKNVILSMSTTSPSENATYAETTAQRIQQDSAYVHIQNYVATIDPTITTHLPASEVQFVQNAVKNYNALPLSSRENKQVQIKQLQPMQTNLCAAYIQTYNYWWGTELVLNHCAVIDLEAGGGLAAIALGLVSGPVGAILGVEIAILAFADSQCSSGGAYFDMPVGLPPYSRPLC